MPPHDRCAIILAATALIRERAKSISQVLTLEQGKPLAESLREVTSAADIIDFLAEESRRLASRGVPPRTAAILSQTVLRVPVGPVAAFTPWNFPANLPARKPAALSPRAARSSLNRRLTPATWASPWHAHSSMRAYPRGY